MMTYNLHNYHVSLQSFIYMAIQSKNYSYGQWTLFTLSNLLIWVKFFLEDDFLFASLWIFKENPNLVFPNLKFVSCAKRLYPNEQKLDWTTNWLRAYFSGRTWTYHIRGGSYSESCLVVLHIHSLTGTTSLANFFINCWKVSWLTLVCEWKNLIWCLSCWKYHP